MKKIFTFCFLMFCFGRLYAAAPTSPSSNLDFTTIDGTQLAGTFRPGNGTYRIVVMKAGSPIVGLPINGMEYSAQSSFGAAGAAFTAPGEYVVAKNTSSFSVSNLLPGTTYYISVFEYNGSGANSQYLMTPLAGYGATVNAPTNSSSNFRTSSILGNTVTINWTNGNGSSRLLVARKGSSVNATPQDLLFYTSDQNFGAGSKLGTDNFVVYKGGGSSATIKNLEPNTTYQFALFEYNGSSAPMYLRPGALYSITTAAGPSSGPTGGTITNVDGNRLTISVSAGNGNRRLFIAKKGSPVTATPVNGTSYSVNGDFGSGAQIAPGEFVVGASSSNSATVTNLEPNTIYYFRVYEYDTDNNGTCYYLTTSYAVKSGSTAVTPTPPANAIVNSLSGNSATISYLVGNGTYRLAIVKEGSQVNAVPTNLAKYRPSSIFGNGDQITPGNFVVGGGMNGNSFTVNNLVPGTTYHVAVYEYNGSNFPVYSSSAATVSFRTPNEPTSASTGAWTSAVEGNGFRLSWANGNGAKRIVIAKKGGPVTGRPVDQISYAANQVFAQGDELGTGEYVVYNGVGNNVEITGLDPAATYNLAIFEYNVGGDGKPDYLTSAFLSTAQMTAIVPTQVSTEVTASIGSNQITLSWTNGNGNGRLVVMKEGSAVTASPLNLVSYQGNTVHGNGEEISSNEYVVYAGSGNNVTITGLSANKTYYYRIFEFNGNHTPIYNLVNYSSGQATTSSALPVKLLFFKAQSIEGHIRLQWATSLEISHDRFELERSSDGIRFSRIAVLPATGGLSGDTTQYNYLDPVPGGTYYYRLKQLDRNGYTDYSETLVVHTLKARLNLHVYPNPVKQSLQIQLTGDNSPLQTIQLYDANGRIQLHVKISSGQPLNISRLPSGLYHLLVKTNRGEYRTSLIKH